MGSWSDLLSAEAKYTARKLMGDLELDVQNRRMVRMLIVK